MVCSENSSELKPCVPVWNVQQGPHLEQAFEIYCTINNISRKRIFTIQNGLYSISRWQNPHCSKRSSSLTYWALPSPTYPKVSKPDITSIHILKLCCWVTLWVNSSTAGITDLHKQTKVQKEIVAWAKGRMSVHQGKGRRSKLGDRKDLAWHGWQRWKWAWVTYCQCLWGSCLVMFFLLGSLCLWLYSCCC